MAHEIIKRAFLNKTPAREDFFVLSVSNIVDVLPGQVIEASQVQDLFDSGVDVTINLPMPPAGMNPPMGGDENAAPNFRNVQTPAGAKKGCTSCGKKKKEQEAQAEPVLEETSVEVAEVTE